MKILFTNCWQANNTGDNAIWKSMMGHLREAFPQCQFIISSQAVLLWDMEQLSEYCPETIRMDWWNHLKGIDVVISQGGGYMIRNNMAGFLEGFKKAQALGKPTFFATQTFVGPVDENTQGLLKEVLNNADLVVAREKETERLLLDAGVKNIKVLPDQAFTVKPGKYGKSLPKEAVKIGIRSYAASESFLSEIALFADMVAETIAPVVFIPVGHGKDRDDRVGGRRIGELMRHESVVIDDKVSAEELMDIVRDGILISDRYHGIVCASAMGTPFVALTPDIDFKMPGLLDLFNYPIPILDTKTVKADELFDHVMNIHRNGTHYKELINSKLPEVKQSADKVYKYIIEGIKSYSHLKKIERKLTPIEIMSHQEISEHPEDVDYVRMAIKGKLDILYKLSKEVPSNGIVVEIGSFYGSTAILMGITTKPSVRVHCVELNVFSELTENIKKHGMAGKVAVWAGKSQDVVKLWTTPIDLLFIDGDHAYDSVMYDSKAWSRHVKRGGIIVWHDYYNKLLGCQDVGQAVDDFLEESKGNFEIIMPETAEKIIRVARRNYEDN